jgi:hypothetical protein
MKKKTTKKPLALHLETVRTLSLIHVVGGLRGSGTMCGGSGGCDTWTNPSKYTSEASCL